MFSKTFLLFISTSAFSAVFSRQKKINFDFFLLHWPENIGIMCICIERVTKKNQQITDCSLHICVVLYVCTPNTILCVCVFRFGSTLLLTIISVWLQWCVWLFVSLSVCVCVFHTGLHQVRSKTEGFFPSLSNELYGWTAYMCCTSVNIWLCMCVRACVFIWWF